MKTLRTAALTAIVLGVGAAPAEGILLPTFGQARGATLRAADLTVRNTRDRPNGYVAYRVGACKQAAAHELSAD